MESSVIRESVMILPKLNDEITRTSSMVTLSNNTLKVFAEARSSIVTLSEIL